MSTRDELVHAVTAFDHRRMRRVDYNIYALAQYLHRVDDIMADIAAGAAVDAAICAGFTPGPLRNACLKACGFAASKVESHGSYLGLPVYQPAARRPQENPE
jgi:hypothetical protein